MKKFLCTRFVLFSLVFLIFNVVVIKANENLYSPKDVMKNGNTTIEGGRSSYDSFKVQNYLLKGTKDSNLDKMVFLTFDDGPSPDNTPLVLDILKEYGVKATFFALGVNLDNNQKNAEILKRALLEGHAIANHGYSHNYSFLYPNRVINYENFIQDMNRSNSIFKSILGEDFNARVLRFPGGIRSWKGQNETLERLNSEGYSVIEWNSLSGDAEGFLVSDPNVLVENAIKYSVNKSMVVLLMHDFAGKRGSVSAQALPKIIEYFKEQNYQFRTLY